MDDVVSKEHYREMIKGLCSIIDSQQKREEELIKIIRELIKENTRRRRRKMTL